jgi:hypothetical protein
VGRWISCVSFSNGTSAAVRSFWVPAWLSELVSWEKIAEDYLRAKELLALGDKSNLKTWIQTTCAEPWVEEQPPAIRGIELLSRAEAYDAEVPSGALCLVAANRLLGHWDTHHHEPTTGRPEWFLRGSAVAMVGGISAVFVATVFLVATCLHWRFCAKHPAMLPVRHHSVRFTFARPNPVTAMALAPA